MTSQQKNIIKWLLIANFVLLFCIVPVVVFISIQPPGTDPVQVAVATVQALLPPTPTRGPTATPTRVLPTPTLEAGWKLYPATPERFAIAMPATWDSQVISKDKLATSIDDLAKKNPTLANSLRSQPAGYLDNVKFVGFETDRTVIASGFTPNVNIIHSVEATDLTLDRVITASQKEFADLKINAQSRRLKIPAGDAVEFKFSMPLKMTNNQNVIMVGVQYVLVRARDQYGVSCTAIEKQAAKYTPICEKIGQSFHWVN